MQSLLLIVLAVAVAQQLNPDNIQTLQPAGPDAVAGLGDWVLSNGTLCAAISDIDHETGFTPWGGALVDVHHCGRADDQWPFQHVLPNLNKDAPLQPLRITSRQADGQAAVEVLSRGYGLQLTSRYQIDVSLARQLRIVHRLSRLSEGDAVTMLGILMLHPHLALTPFALSSFEPGYSRGFSYPSMNRQDTMSMLDAMLPADRHVFVGDVALGDISYGVHLQRAELINGSGEARPLPRFQQTGPTYSIQGMLSRPPWLGGSGKLGLLEFGQSQLMDIEVGEVLLVEQVIYLGDRAAVSAITDQWYQGAVIKGSVDSNRAVIEVSDSRGRPLTSLRTDRDGQFEARLPVDIKQIQLDVNTPWGDSPPRFFDVGSRQTGIGRLASAAPALLDIVADTPMRLIFIGLDGTPNPDFYDNGLDFRIDDKPVVEIQSANYLSFAGVESDPRRVALRPGNYRVLASRGMAFGVTEAQITVKAGENSPLQIIAPLQEVSTRGWLAADLHVHSAASFDSYLSIDERLRGFVAQGSDVLIATEHNALVNYQGDVRRLGLSELLQVIGGTELTGMARTATMPYTNGHLNVFPVTASPEQFAGGIPAHEGIRLYSLYRNVRQRFGAVLFQLNHPRDTDPLDPDGDGSYFDHLVSGTSYDPGQALGAEANRSLLEKDPHTGLRDVDFQLLEIANGSNFQNYEITRGDWFSLLNQGEKIVASANSDSHGTRALVAQPQNYVKLPGPYSEEKFLAAVANGHMMGTTGPWLDVLALGADHKPIEIGATVDGGVFELQLSVDAASWVPVDELIIYINGEVHHRQSIHPGSRLKVPMSLGKDSYVVVQVTGKPDALYQMVAPGFTPFAFSNPIFIDADSDGTWTAPCHAAICQPQ